MSECPDYYRLADGRDFATFLECEATFEIDKCIAESGMPAPTSYTIHCLFSAMEHQFRQGRKAGEDETDIEAATWWYNQALMSYERKYQTTTDIFLLIKNMQWITDIERAKIVNLKMESELNNGNS